MTAGYYRFPAIHQDTIVFVSEDDLWTVPRQGGVARRLTSNLGEVNYPALSPDGEWLAFVGREEGMSEVYLMPAGGGSARRLTYLNSRCQVLGWSRDGQAVLFASNYRQSPPDEYGIFAVAADSRNGAVSPVPVGPARTITWGPAGQVVIGRNTGDPARWKRYRGGTAGHLWIDRAGNGQFERLLAGLAGNIASPMWLEGSTGSRVYFVSDHEGIGNLYSCTPSGDDLRRHTDHEDFYTRNPSTDGTRIVYHAGADLYVYDPAEQRSERVPVDWRSPRVQRNRRFVYAGSYLDHARLRSQGDAVVLSTRGKAFAMYNHDGPVIQLGKRDGIRYRLPDWLNDGRRVLVVDDAAGEEELVIEDTDPNHTARRLAGLDIGRPLEMRISPKEDKVAIANHRNELLVVDLERATVAVIDRSDWRQILGFGWSPDGRWLAYGFPTTLTTTEIRLARYELAQPEAEAGPAPAPETAHGAPGAADQPGDEAPGATPATPSAPGQWSTPVAVTRPVLHDVAPAFDPEGRYLYFLSYREFNPVYDTLHFDLGFPWGMRPYLITLRKDLPNPFLPRPDSPEEEEDEDDEDDADEDADEHGEDEGDEGDEPAGDEDADDEEEGGKDEAGDGDEDDEDDEDENGADDEDGEDDGDDGDFARRQVRLTANAPTEDAAVGLPLPSEPPANAKGNRKDEKKSKHSGDHKRPKELVIDLDGMDQRVLVFPVQDARYGQIAGAPGRALFTSFPIRGTLDEGRDADDGRDEESGTLRAWVFKDFKSEAVAENVTSFELSRNAKKLIYLSGRRLRVISATEKAPGDSGPSRKSGWVDINRVKVSVNPPAEWEQMFREAWRLQRDHFWTEDMSQVDWHVVYDRYFPLIERVSTRSEFSDLLWEMQGELGTSHAYEFGGDYRPSPHYSQGALGADLTWDPEAGGYRVSAIVAGDSWQQDGSSPLLAPGVDVRDGDLLLGINGQPLDATVSPAQLLVNLAGHEVLLTLAERAAAEEASANPAPALTEGKPGEAASAAKPQTRNAIVKTLYSDYEARYRAWVEGNRRRVHAATEGRIGYLHIPDMGPRGYAEFHRGYLAEVARAGLIVDVRYNGGGHVSQLLLEKLARRRIGYDKSRWSGLSPYPSESVGGPIVALTNEQAGSDGDIFCHSFKLLKLGPLIGKRTWGGVIGISPRNQLVDGTITTQPEFSFWFEDVGWKVENYGTDPDIEVDITPQDYMAGNDTQLERAIQEARRLLAERPPLAPDLGRRPSRALPKLPRKDASIS